MELITPSNYNETLIELKKRINLAQYKSFSAVNTELILMYLDIGKVLSEKLKTGWGDGIVDVLSNDLQSEYSGVKGFSSRNLRRMKLIYEEIHTNIIWTQLVAKLPWGHTNMIFAKIKNDEKRTFYLQKCLERGWSRSILEEEIKFDAYSKQVNFQSNFENTIVDDKVIAYRLSFKDEYNLSFLNLEDTHTERELETAIVENISKTLGQFGNDFAFMGRQFRLEVDNKEYFIDLLFYHRKLKSMIALELKASEFKPEHSQQLNWYLHLLDKTVKYPEDNPSIGILLCKSKSKLTVEYALEMANNPMGIATYNYKQLPKEIAKFLPTEKELKKIFNDAEKLNNGL
ncbi:putative nuclease of restriction endonuclease-like (RecB) superfamily [Flavobacterium arsenatis]|uniref:Nuclease of restriction endonuclease-like (RecB) superfamily n=1 Tax=Flavobacterium arsenatis TaxID=1484332 RepID=A0ABU1TT12_9FLAO|nr:PDDEXK nuclease domain-containing protein [Flavobacterium arsenatis]MDR6969031.1 putative nuclease of restriction endonuclease-like (RecB) superfamily [Flavobacterium arsenatis]